MSKKGSSSSTGVVAFYAVIPISSDGSGPDLNQAPILRKDSTVGSSDGNSFILTENVDFADSNNEIVVARVDNTTGQPTHYAIKSFGRVISGELKQETFTIGEYQRFLRVALAGADISEIISVEDHLADGGFGSWLRESLIDMSSHLKLKNMAFSSNIIGAVGSEQYLLKLGGF